MRLGKRLNPHQHLACERHRMWAVEVNAEQYLLTQHQRLPAARQVQGMMDVWVLVIVTKQLRAHLGLGALLRLMKEVQVTFQSK